VRQTRAVLRAVRVRWTPLALTLTVIAACGGPASSSSTPQRTTRAAALKTAAPTTPTAVPTPTPTPVPTPVPAQTLSRPVIVQVENLAAARPQSGLSLADVVVEYEVEGGLTRFSAIYLKPPAGAVGPVRSARTITVQLTTIYSAALLFSGAGTYVLGLLQHGLPAYDEDTARGDLFRITARSAPHNLYTDGSHVADIVTHVAGSSMLALPARTDPTALPAGGTPATRVAVPVTFSEQPVFTWSPADGGWVLNEPDTGPATDADTGKRWAPATVVVMQVPVTTDPRVSDAEGSLGLDHAITGTGPAEILSGGRLYTGSFTQGATGLPAITLADGSPAPIAAGQIMLIYTRIGLTPRVVG
jgi:hypothetical protein